MEQVSPEYVDKKPKSQSHTPAFESKLPQLKSALRKKRNNKTKHGREKKKKKSQHPFDKWVKMRHTMQEADISNKTLIEKLADFFQNFYPVIHLLEPYSRSKNRKTRFYCTPIPFDTDRQ